MFAALARLLAITGSTLILAILAVVLVRWMGSFQSYESPPHDWLAETDWRLFEPPAAELCGVHRSPGKDKAIWVVHVRRGAEGWTSDCAVPLAQTLKSLTPRRILLKIESKDSGQLNAWLDDLVKEAESSGASIAVWAPAQKISRYLRKLAPQWLYAADSGALMRLHLFTSLWLEPAMEFWPDFVVASPSPKVDARLSAREVGELHRRHKRVVWEGESIAPFAVDGKFIK